MKEQLEILIQMQKFDTIIGEKNILTKELPQQLNSLKQSLKNADETAAATKSELDENQKDQKLKELDIADNNAKSAKYKNQLLTIETNKEYKALNSEINHLEKQNSGIDDELIGGIKSIFAGILGGEIQSGIKLQSLTVIVPRIVEMSS